MQDFTRRLWDKQNQPPGDRARLFRAVSKVVQPASVLYPGCYVDIAPSFVFPDVTYADTDRRAARFFQDDDGIREIIAANGGPPAAEFRFIHGDYTGDLGLDAGSFDLLVSLYSGPMSDYCLRYLRPGGWFLANASHGDVALAALDPQLELRAVVLAAGDAYAVTSDDLEPFVTPKSSRPSSREDILKSGRGIAYRKTASAYVFRKRQALRD